MTDIAKLGIEVDSRDVVNADKDLDNLTIAAKKTDGAIDNLAGEVADVNTKLKNTSRAANDSTKGFNSLGSKAGRAGIQIQQLVGQVQGGQNAMLALSQQSADLGIVMGAPLVGVVVSLGAAVAATLIPSLLDAGDEVERLADITERLGNETETTESGIKILSNEIRTLAKVSKSAAAAQIASSLLDAKDAADLARKSIKGISEDLVGGFFSTTSYQELIAPFEIVGDQSGSLSRTLEITTEQADELQAAFKSFGDYSKGSGGGDVLALSDRFNELFVTIENPSEKLRVFQKSLADVSQDARIAADTISILESFTGDFGETNEVTASLTKDLVSALRDEAESIDKVIAAKKKIDSSFGGYEEVLARRLALTSELTEVEKVLFEIEQGRLQGISDSQQKKLTDLAAELDLQKQLKDEAKALAKEEKEAAKNAKKIADEELAENEKIAKSLEDQLAGALIGGSEDGFRGVLEGFGDMLLQMAAQAVAADIIGGLFNSAGVSGGSSGNTAGLVDMIGSFAGFFDSGGSIPAGQFGIAGENGPEIVTGPANVTSTKETAAMSGGASIGTQNFVFPNVSNANEARIAAAQAARQFNSAISNSARFS